ncbi:MAG: glycoside hydrolase family 3 N-terminal domain-containing protein [Chloroflexia bacterium]
MRVALHPMIDLATEPRWARANGTFGEDAALASRMVAAYIRGFQGESLAAQRRLYDEALPGGGPQMDGEDAHFAYGREQVYPGDNFEYHLIPFEAAFEAGTAQIMPYYGMPVGLPLEEVGFSPKEVITGMLRGRFGFDGMVCTDWGLLTDKEIGGTVMVARAWGVEHLSVEERTAKAIEAGVDQFGGEACPDVVVALVQAGVVSAARLDESLRRLLRDKFRLGLVDDPYLDLDAAERIVGSEAFLLAGVEAQRRSIVLLKNGDAPGGKALPLGAERSIYVENVSAEAAAAYGRVVSSVEDADVAILRLATPYEPRVTDFLESFFHAGDLSFPAEELSRILGILARVPTVVDVYLERAAVIPEIAAQAAALLASFGSSDEALLDVIFGRHSPSGKLPFELPSSMEAVREQKEDLPYDSESPLFPFGHGLAY